MSHVFAKPKIYAFVLVMMGALLFAFLSIRSAPTAQASVVKTVMCHKPGTEDQATIEVSENAVHAHEKHGDIVGTACEDIRQTSELCSILDGYEIAPVNAAPTYRCTESELAGQIWV